jgi:hypothetical protein
LVSSQLFSKRTQAPLTLPAPSILSVAEARALLTPAPRQGRLKVVAEMPHVATELAAVLSQLLSIPSDVPTIALDFLHVPEDFAGLAAERIKQKLALFLPQVAAVSAQLAPVLADIPYITINVAKVLDGSGIGSARQCSTDNRDSGDGEDYRTEHGVSP